MWSFGNSNRNTADLGPNPHASEYAKVCRMNSCLTSTDLLIHNVLKLLVSMFTELRSSGILYIDL